MSCQINAFIHAVSGQAVMHELLLTTKCDSGNFFQRLLYKLKAHINICINGHLLTTLLCLDNQFLLHDAMLAWYMLSSCLCVGPSVCHKPVLYRNDWTDRAGFWHGCFIHRSYAPKIRAISPELCPKLWISEFVMDLLYIFKVRRQCS